MNEHELPRDGDHDAAWWADQLSRYEGQATLDSTCVLTAWAAPEVVRAIRVALAATPAHLEPGLRERIEALLNERIREDSVIHDGSAWREGRIKGLREALELAALLPTDTEAPK
jgi:hypothetical protein